MRSGSASKSNVARPFRRFDFKTHGVVGLAFGVFLALGGLFWCTSVRMPGSSHPGPLGELSPAAVELSKALEHHVRHLAVTIGERNTLHPEALNASAAFIENQVATLGLASERHPYEVDGQTVYNIEVLCPARTETQEVLVVGAHYDSARGTGGANDNASGVAVLLELARHCPADGARRALRFVWFTNEEPPHFQTEAMGSLHYARKLQSSGIGVAAMLSLETLGYYSDAEDSQKYPTALQGLFPDRGNFLAFVGASHSKALVRHSVAEFRAHAKLPSEGVALSDRISGIGWSDHWAFWQIGVPALMVTDTAPFRYEHYHRPSDTPKELDFQRLALATEGLVFVLRSLLETETLD
jgi:hypothetical protein